jgi:4-aminobutyrate aminotransferase-like enzyme
MKNASPGTPDLVAMSFKHGFHGRLFGSLSLTRSKAIHKVKPVLCDDSHRTPVLRTRLTNDDDDVSRHAARHPRV